MAFNLPQFDKIKDFCSFQKQLQILPTKQNLSKIQLINTSETINNNHHFVKKDQSQKRQYKKTQTSFEKDFLYEHLEAFDFKMGNYLQQMFGQNLRQKRVLLSQGIFPMKSIGVDADNQLQYYLSSGSSLLSQEQKQMLMENLCQQQKLYDFLQGICVRSCDQVAYEMILLTYDIQLKYNKIKLQQWGYQKILAQSKNLVEILYPNVKNNPHIKYLTLESTLIKPILQNEQKDQETKKIIQFLILTIFLILSHQFVNPFFEQKIQQQLKRHIFFNNYSVDNSYQQFSDDEELQLREGFGMGRRKNKLY